MIRPQRPTPPIELVVLDATGSRRFPLTQRVVIGRDDEADLQIVDARSSRFHCRIEPASEGGVAKVTDLGSSNGTFVNGNEISQVRIKAGDVVGVGEECRLGIVAKGEPDPDWIAGVAAAPEAAPAERPAPQAAPVADAPQPAPAASAAAPERVAEAEAESDAANPVVRSRGRSGRAARGGARPSARGRRSAAPGAFEEKSAPAEPAPREESPSPAPREEAAPSRGASPRPVASRRRSNTGLYVVGGALFLLLVVGWMWWSHSSRENAAEAALFAARALQEEGNDAAALAAFKDVVATWPDARVTPDARAGIDSVQFRMDRKKQARRGMDELLLGADQVPGGQLVAQVKEHVRRFKDVLSEAEQRDWQAEGRAKADQQAQSFVSRVRQAVLLDLQAGSFGLALGRVLEAESSPLLFGDARSRLIDLRSRVENDARRNYGVLVLGLKGMAPRPARDRLIDGLNRFSGTAHEGELRARKTMLDGVLARMSERAARGETVAATVETAPPPPQLLDLLTKAESLASERNFAKAIPALNEAILVAPSEQRPQLEVRLKRLQHLAQVVDAIAQRVKDAPDRFRGIRVGESDKGNVGSADRSRVELVLGPKARVFWTWSRMRPDRLTRLLGRAQLRGEPALWSAEFLLEMRAEKEALTELLRVWEIAPTLRDSLQPLVAEARRMDSVPEGGFQPFDGQFVTLEEKDEAVFVARLRQLGDQVIEAGPGAWREPADQLHALGPRGRATLEGALRSRLVAIEKRFGEFAPFRGGAVAATRARLTTELIERRKAALALIFDSKAYPYPYGPDGNREVQGRVDELVDRVRAIWETPALHLVEQDPDMKALWVDASEVVAAFDGDTEAAEEESTGQDSAGQSAKAPDLEKLLASLNDRIAIHRNAEDTRIQEHWQKVKAWNAAQTAVITQEERDAHRITNEYRVMMGRRAVMISDELVKAARGHSAEMQERGYFAHQSPVPGRKSPTDRARLAGWSGGVSENIARGSRTPAQVIAGWCHSSGHHRNILIKGHTHLGVGKSPQGFFWTQNFGKGSVNPPR